MARLCTVHRQTKNKAYRQHARCARAARAQKKSAPRFFCRKLAKKVEKCPHSEASHRKVPGGPPRNGGVLGIPCDTAFQRSTYFSRRPRTQLQTRVDPSAGRSFRDLFLDFSSPSVEKKGGGRRPSASFRAPALFLELGRRKVQKKIAKTPPRLGIQRRAWEARGRSRRGHGAGPWGYHGTPLWPPGPQ